MFTVWYCCMRDDGGVHQFLNFYSSKASAQSSIDYLCGRGYTATTDW